MIQSICMICSSYIKIPSHFKYGTWVCGDVSVRGFPWSSLSWMPQDNCTCSCTCTYLYFVLYDIQISECDIFRMTRPTVFDVFHLFISKPHSVFTGNYQEINTSVQRIQCDQSPRRCGCRHSNKGGLFVCSDPGFEEASPPTSFWARCQATRLCPAGSSPPWTLTSRPLFLLLLLSSSVASLPSTVTRTPFWLMNSWMESISGFNP